MKKQSLILDVDSDEINFFKKQYVDIPTLHKEIEEMFENKPDGRKKKETKEWKEKINFLIDIYNKSCKFKSYNKVK